MDHFTILRHGRKIKSAAALAVVAAHNERRDAKSGNIDLARTPNNLIAIGSGDLVADVESVFASLDRPPRSNAVLARELLLSATPEWFGGVEGHWKAERMAAWRDATTAWLHQTFPGQVVQFVVHLDERSVHGHAVIVPVVEKEVSKRGRKPKGAEAKAAHDAVRQQVRTLDHDAVMGKRSAFSDRQTDYAKALAPLGLKRGVLGSKAHHVPVRHHYAALDADREAAEQDRIDATIAGAKADAVRQMAEISLGEAAAERDRAKAEHLLARRERQVLNAKEAVIDAVAAGEITGTHEDPRTRRRSIVWRSSVPQHRRDAFLAIVHPAFNEVWDLLRRLLALAVEVPSRQRGRGAR